MELEQRSLSDTTDNNTIDVLPLEQSQRLAHAVGVMGTGVYDSVTFVCIAVHNKEKWGRAEVLADAAVEPIVVFYWNTNVHEYLQR